ncbi:hypothetical protein IEO21_09975 [Rhodonia placenta]|uniref:Uncharacterized protein n=1 Tax=Rhodonia placenta TaxID=104341 RepID=A0A8H7TXY6_9APHY|nr:hypothetical protein IEO21_09975 [Postia placenta]
MHGLQLPRVLPRPRQAPPSQHHPRQVQVPLQEVQRNLRCWRP